MSDTDRNQDISKKLIEQDMRQLFEQRLTERIRRHLEIKPHPIVANYHFSPVSAECIELFRDGYFYGCIALVQAVAEALVRFLCEKNGWRAKKVFEKNVEKLSTRNFISKEAKGWLIKTWSKRDDYHHLNPSMESDRQTLEALAKEKVELLKNVEAEIFHFTIIDGRIAPKQPKYWNINGNKADVYLRCT